jgi:phosphatidylglycerophosphatase A
LSSGAYLGYLPRAPGTFGSLWGIPIFYWLSGQAFQIQTVFLLGSIGFSILVSGQAEKILGRKDPPQIVIDEIVGYLTAVMGLPFSWSSAWLAFFIFRIMDISKPYPIRKIDRKLPGGWGVALDDVLAGIYTQILLRLWILYLSRGA